MSQIVFFDGLCNLCNGFVDFVVRRDSVGVFKFAPLQGKAAQEKLTAELRGELRTVALWSQGQVYTKSDAALTVLTQLGGSWVLFKGFWLLPKFLRDLVYDLVAGNRYAWFGKRDTCRLPTEEERARFLD
jgi:predicted DCC family thiol-disulfide oxidoreductase YuxK